MDAAAHLVSWVVDWPNPLDGPVGSHRTYPNVCPDVPHQACALRSRVPYMTQTDIHPASANQDDGAPSDADTALACVLIMASLHGVAIL